jgi:hypothetical protein
LRANGDEKKAKRWTSCRGDSSPVLDVEVDLALTQHFLQHTQHTHWTNGERRDGLSGPGPIMAIRVPIMAIRVPIMAIRVSIMAIRVPIMAIRGRWRFGICSRALRLALYAPEVTKPLPGGGAP